MSGIASSDGVRAAPGIAAEDQASVRTKMPPTSFRAAVFSFALFGALFWLQAGHLAVHISLALTGHAIFGPEADTQLIHFSFNTAIAALTVLVAVKHRRNPWVYPLLMVAWLHEIEDLYTYVRFVLATGALDGPIIEGEHGLLGRDGALALLPIAQVELHNWYNGLEWILITLGFAHELDAALSAPVEARAT